MYKKFKDVLITTMVPILGSIKGTIRLKIFSEIALLAINRNLKLLLIKLIKINFSFQFLTPNKNKCPMKQLTIASCLLFL